jgi:hypothetical protein
MLSLPHFSPPISLVCPHSRPFQTIDWEPLPKVPYQLWKYTETITHVVLDFNEIEEIPHRMCTMKKLRVIFGPAHPHNSRRR